jgi:hypothetical protein
LVVNLCTRPLIDISKRRYILIAKKITIVLMPEGSKGTRQFKVPICLPLFLIIFLVFCALSLSRVIVDYRAMQEQMPRLSQLKKENEKQKRHFIYLTQRLNQIKGKMGELKEIDQKLRVMMNLETADERSPRSLLIAGQLSHNKGASEPSPTDAPFTG